MCHKLHINGDREIIQYHAAAISKQYILNAAHLVSMSLLPKLLPHCPHRCVLLSSFCDGVLSLKIDIQPFVIRSSFVIQQVFANLHLKQGKNALNSCK